MTSGSWARIDEYTRRVYAEILIGFIRKDYRRVAEVHFEAGYVPRDRDIDEFARALRAVGEPIFGMDASRISMARLLAYLFEVTERFGMETRTELILLQRTMVVVEGVARSLDPHINIWQVARPVVEGYIRREPRAAGRCCAIWRGRRGCWRGSGRSCRSWPRRFWRGSRSIRWRTGGHRGSGRRWDWSCWVPCLRDLRRRSGGSRG